MSDQSKVCRTGGPKSVSGKIKSSQNSLKHGITSSVATSVSELALINSFTQKLEDFYDPQSPLEKLQIQRIAICRAKLSRLYEVESARLEMRSNKLEHSTESILKELPYVEGVVKGMVHEMAIYGQLILPLGLSPVILEKIAQEVHGQEVRSEIKNPWRLLTSLSHFLEGIISFNTNETLDSRLELVSSYISKVLGQGDLYHEHLKLMLGSNDNFGLEQEDVVEEEDELDILIKQSQEKYQQKQRGHQKVSVAPAVATEEKLQNPTSVDILEQCKYLWIYIATTKRLKGHLNNSYKPSL